MLLVFSLIINDYKNSLKFLRILNKGNKSSGIWRGRGGGEYNPPSS